MDFDGSTAYAKYGSFSVASEAHNYELNVDSFEGKYRIVSFELKQKKLFAMLPILETLGTNVFPFLHTILDILLKVAPYSCRADLYRSVWSFANRQMF